MNDMQHYAGCILEPRIGFFDFKTNLLRCNRVLLNALEEIRRNPAPPITVQIVPWVSTEPTPTPTESDLGLETSEADRLRY